MGSYLCFWCKTVIEGDATLSLAPDTEKDNK